MQLPTIAVKICSHLTKVINFKLYSLLSDRIYCNSDANKSCLALKPPKNLSHQLNEFNSFTSDINNTLQNVINYNCYHINDLQTLKEFTDKSSFSLNYLNTSSLSKNRTSYKIPYSVNEDWYWYRNCFWIKNNQKYTYTNWYKYSKLSLQILSNGSQCWWYLDLYKELLVIQS